MNSWDAPITIAETDENVPIARGVRPRPPSLIGVERKSASVPPKNFSTRDIVAKLIAATKTPVRNNNDLLVPPSSITPPSVRVLNSLDSGNSSVTVSLKKIVPTSQAVNRKMEQMTHGRK
jgi:hypothetical protein